ncbi:heterokaryon incompatibility protein-domain-containing protein [Podospora didyma]|uniref:Heterokaryon incompatibility protein-domain-containing protein n=1 Tax=Podospora didyma TaxID=330526 RepID=A0AAE0NI55_9PEZI|nr:heterokaryon incompatibility protein-domain-containing protein [Podospora didyma]
MMESAEGQLCQTCTAAFDGETFVHAHGEWHRTKGENSNYFNRTHHTSYGGLVAGNNGKCFVCSWLWAKHVPPTDSSDGFRIYCQVNGYGSQEVLNVHFHVVCPWASNFDLNVAMAKDLDSQSQYYHAPLRPLPWSDLEERPWLGLDDRLGSNEHLEVIRSWVSSCNANHGHCSPTRSPAGQRPGFLPTRVIDVKDAGIGEVRLRDRDEIEKEDQGGTYPVYWTLSHRWPADPDTILQLRKTTEERFRDGISVDELSPTFRDAVLLVCRLGYRYIWIDSLCVSQDSLDDWQKEANVMVDVYRHSFCNLSATGASYDPSNSGLFCERKLNSRLFFPFKTNAMVVNYVTRDQREEKTGPWMVSNKSAWADEVESAPISSRGWVVQERFLATRVLHFTRSQVYWECLESCHCADDPSGKFLISDRLGTGSASTTTSAKTGYKVSRLELAQIQATLASAGKPYSDPNQGSRSGHSYHSQWGTIVGIYVGCGLTKESDRFLAMSGIAKVFGEVNGDEYLAGLWKRMLYTDLLWHSKASQGVDARRRRSDGTESYAPFWSWASVVGGNVQLSVPQDKYGSLPTSLIRLVRSRIVPEPPEGGDNMGMLRSAELEIRCMRYYYSWRGREEMVLKVFTDPERTNCYFEQKKSTQISLHLDTSELVERFAAADEISGVCFPVYGVYGGYGGGSNQYIMLEHESGDRFRRIGLLRAGSIGGWISGWSEARSSLITLV